MKRVLMAIFLLSLSIHASGFLPVAKITNFKGTPKINSESVIDGMEVAEGNTVELQASDSATIQFQNGHTVKLVGAKVLVERLNPKETLLKLEKGAMLVNIKKLTPKELFQVRSNNVDMDSGNAEWFVNNMGDATRILVGKGVVRVQRLKETMELKANEEATISKLPSFEKKKVKKEVFKKTLKAL